MGVEKSTTAPCIALLTDFGTLDTFVGVMKGVVTRISPHVPIIDLTHNITPGDIREAAFKLWQAVPYFPRGTIFCVVVDPGVGSDRRPVAVAWPDRVCVGPDNGLFTYLLVSDPDCRAHRLIAPDYQLPRVSSTFHGRDLFAPAAAHLSLGLPPASLGPPITDLARFPLPELELIEGPSVRGEILRIDRFGNFTTSIGTLRGEDDDLVLEPWLPHCPPARLPIAGLCLQLPNGVSLDLRATFGDVEVGEALTYVGSDGLLEIAVNRGRAADVLPLALGQEVVLGYPGRARP
jgi:S-adenosylmethionine hydrolase